MQPVYLIGSGKTHGHSTSEALARYLHGRLCANESEPFVAFEAKKTLHAGQEKSLLAALTGADLVVLCTPLYIDSLPYPVVHALQAIADEQAARAQKREPGAPAGERAPCRCVALLNCGFPEAAQCALALRMCELFAKQAGLEWAGGLALGGGEAVAGRELVRASGPAYNARRALDHAAEALLKGEALPDAAVRLMATPTIPGFLYRLLGSLGWRRRAHALGTRTPLDAQPFTSKQEALHGP